METTEKKGIWGDSKKDILVVGQRLKRNKRTIPPNPEGGRGGGEGHLLEHMKKKNEGVEARGKRGQTKTSTTEFREERAAQSN